VFNLGNPEEVTIAGLARKIIALTSAAVDIDLVPYGEAYEEGFEDMERRVPDISKVAALTGYSPRHTLDDALRLTLEWFVQSNVLGEAAGFRHAEPASGSGGAGSADG
jgi:UDP-glucose 4-epimerase